MLPLRICLEGFLSYRDRTEFDFSSARLWMLCGPNGAGKSSVFDALRFVIYGAHRAGKQNAELLVHHASARLRVEADLQLGEDVFRLVRTLGRSGARPTWQVRQKIEGEWRDVPETAMKTDYERWIAAHIGLSDEAFCAAVYLSQGHADAILNPDPQARYDLLSQLVDLRVYEGWHERAEERRLALRAAVQDARRRWENAPTIDAQGLELRREEARALAHQRSVVGERERELDALRSDAARFGTWQGALETLSAKADQTRALLLDEAEIERDFARLTHRERHLPPLQELLRLAERQTKIQGELGDLCAQQSHSKRAFDEANSAHAVALQLRDQARSAGQKAGESLGALELERALLAPGEAQLERRQTLRDELDEAATQLALLRAAGSEVRTLTGETDQARETARLLPSWRRFVAARSAAREEDALWQSATFRAAELDAQLALRAGAQDAATRASSDLQSAWESAQARQTRAKARLDAAQNARRDFARVEGNARCHFCGQELSPEYARLEAQRLERELALAQDEHKRAQSQAKAARTARDDAQKQLEAMARELAQIERAIAQSRLETALHLQKRDDALSLARGSWDELGAARGRVWQENPFEWAFNSARPGADELAHWETQAARLPELEQLLAGAQRRERERESLTRDAERSARELAPLDLKWNDDATRNWQARWNALDDERNALLRAQESERQSAQIQQKSLNECAALCLAARARHDELAGRIGPLEGEARALARQVESSWPPVRAAIQSVANEAIRYNLVETDHPIVGSNLSASIGLEEGGSPAWLELRGYRPLPIGHSPTDENNDLVVGNESNDLVSTREQNVAHERTVSIDDVRQLATILAATAKSWNEELQGLQSAQISARHGELARARVELDALKGEAAFLTREIEGLPAAARRSPGELESELSGTRDELEIARLEARRAELGVARLEQELGEKARLESEMQEREVEHDRWSEVARLLGPRQLQRHLLREAERGIVREANAVLEAISGGTLRLELRVESEDGSAKVPKVLDVECHHLSGSASSRPVSPAFLSGSQRFRVAVALALGIGRTAARGSGATHSGARVEAILIDEGFGSLDKVGRDEMKDELRVLGRELGRIILVSHQEDFAQGFPARFDISMEAGVSRARRVVE